MNHPTSIWSVIRVVFWIHALAMAWLLAIVPAITGDMGASNHSPMNNLGFCLIALVLIITAYFANKHGDYGLFSLFLIVAEIVSIWF